MKPKRIFGNMIRASRALERESQKIARLQKTGKKPQSQKASITPLKGVETGYVYIIHGGTGLCKIGMTTGDPYKRIAELQTGSPVELKIIAILATDKPQELEQALHKDFTHRRKQGEWFQLTEADFAKFQKKYCKAG